MDTLCPRGLEQFTVPTDFGGVKYPFYVYVTEYARVDCKITDGPTDKPCVGFIGIEDQVQWAKARGGEVPKDVVESFAKLYKIARENNISFVDLTVYALGAAQEDLGDATAKGSDKEKEDAKKAAKAKRDAELKQLAERKAESLPLTNAAPANLRTEFFFRDLRSAPAEEPGSTVVPLLPWGGCAIWHMHFTPEPRRIKVQIEKAVFPAGTGSGGKPLWRQQNELILPLNTGVIERSWCFDSQATPGHRLIRVTIDGASLVSKDFSARPLSEFPGYQPEGKLVADEATIQAANAIHQKMKTSRFVRNPRLAADRGGVVLGGMDVVSLQAKSPTVGKPGIYALWNGGVWLFSTVDNRAAFLRSPATFVPQFGGAQPVLAAKAEFELADELFPAVVNGKLYLAGSEEERDLWISKFSEYAPLAEENWLGFDDAIASSFTPLGREVLALGEVAIPDIDARQREILVRRTAMVDRARSMPDNRKKLVTALGSRSWAYVLLKKPDAAIRDADEALRLAPEEAWIAINRADALVLKRKYPEAIAAYLQNAERYVSGGKAKGCLYIRNDLRDMLDRHVIDAETRALIAAKIPCILESNPGATK